MKKSPLFLVAGLLIFFGIAFYTYKQFDNYARDYVANYTLFKEKQVKIYGNLAQRMMKSGQVDELGQLLTAAQEQQMFDWFLLSYKNEPVFAGPSEVRDLNLKQTAGEVRINEFVSYQTVDLGGDLLLTLGVNKRVEDYIQLRIKNSWKILLQDLLFPFAIALGVFLYFLKDILNLVQILKTGSLQKNLSKFSDLKGRTQESEILIQSLRGYGKALEKMSSEHEVLFRQILPSMRKELFSGEKPPYEFEATLVRLDINRFSELFQNQNRNDLLACVNELFTRVAVLVSRHGGFVHEFVGDEVLFYFKGPAESSFPQALWALRDIDEIVNRDLSTWTQARIGKSLKFKSSLAHGTLRFGPLVDGFSLAGGILIETVRMLSNVQDRDENSIIFDHKWKEFLPLNFNTSTLGEFTLKGLGTSSQILQVSEMPSMDLQHIHLYKSDQNLSIFLKSLKKGLRTSDEKVFVEQIRKVMVHPFYPCSDEIKKEVVIWMKELKTLGFDKALSAVISFLRVIYAPGEKSSELVSVLRGLLEHANPRVVANSIEILNFLQPEEDHDWIEDLCKNSSPRIVASAIIFASQSSAKEYWLKALKRLLNSKTPNEQINGLYALGEIVKLWADRDPVRLESNDEMNSFLQLLPGFLKNPNHGVRQQAEKVLKKVPPLRKAA